MFQQLAKAAGASRDYRGRGGECACVVLVSPR